LSLETENLINLSYKIMNEEKQMEQTRKCPKCKEEVLKGAKKCKHCGADIRNWFMRHKIISILLFFMVIGMISGGSNTGNSVPVSSSPADIQNNNAEQKVQSEKVNKIGDTVSVGNFSYSLQKVEQKSSIGNQYFSKEAAGIYELCYIVLRNNDKEARYADSTMFKLIDDQGRNFTVSTDATTAYSLSYGNDYDLFLKQANPGLEIGGILIFDIPKDAKGLKLEVSGGFASSDKEYIQIN